MFGKNIMNWQIAERGNRFDIEVINWTGTTYSITEMSDGSTLVAFYGFASVDTSVGATQTACVTPFTASINDGSFRIVGSDGGGEIEYLVVGGGANANIYSAGGAGAVIKGKTYFPSNTHYNVRSGPIGAFSLINGAATSSTIGFIAREGTGPFTSGGINYGGGAGNVIIETQPTIIGALGASSSAAWYNGATYDDTRFGGGGGAGGAAIRNGYGYGGKGVTSSITGVMKTYGSGGDGGPSTTTKIGNGYQVGKSATVYWSITLPITIDGVLYTSNPCIIPAKGSPTSCVNGSLTSGMNYGDGGSGGARATSGSSTSWGAGSQGVVYIRYFRI